MSAKTTLLLMVFVTRIPLCLLEPLITATNFSSNGVARDSKVAPNTDSDNSKADARVDEL